MVKIQQFFTKYRHSIVVVTTVMLVLAEAARFGVHSLLAYQAIISVWHRSC